MGRKTVWILGAGFSRPLGGPLLNDLLVTKDRLTLSRQLFALGGEKLRLRGPNPGEVLLGHELENPLLKEPHNAAFVGIHDLCSGFQKHRRGEPNLAGFWSDAEDFLDLLETVCLLVTGSSVPNDVIASAGLVQVQQAFPGKELKKLALDARQAIAFDCSIFLNGADVNCEKWQPFREWACRLDNNHTVVTFNYDLIPERLERVSKSKLLVHPPCCGQGLCNRCEDSKEQKKALVFKVHGSVNWRMRDNVVELMTAESDFFLDSTDYEIAIGIPGPQKQRIVTNVLGGLWKKAMDSIREAETIIFAGYRFPPSDAQARRDILTSIRDNKSPDLKVVTVLGPNNPDENRLVNLINTAFDSSAKRGGRNRELISKPLYIQDFLSLLELVGPESVIP